MRDSERRAGRITTVVGLTPGRVSASGAAAPAVRPRRDRRSCPPSYATGARGSRRTTCRVAAAVARCGWGCGRVLASPGSRAVLALNFVQHTANRVFVLTCRSACCSLILQHALRADAAHTSDGASAPRSARPQQTWVAQRSASMSIRPVPACLLTWPWMEPCTPYRARAPFGTAFALLASCTCGHATVRRRQFATRSRQMPKAPGSIPPTASATSDRSA